MAKFKVGDKIKYGRTPCIVKKIDGEYYLLDAIINPNKNIPMKIEISEVDAHSSAINVSNTVATNDNPKYASLERELKNALTSHDENTIRSAVRKVESQGLEWVAQMDNGLLVDNVDWIVKDMKYNERNPHYIKAVRITDKGSMWNSRGCVVNSTREIVQKALNRRALNYADPNSLAIGVEVRDADTDTPNYGRVGKVIGTKNGFYHIKWNDGGDSWRKTTDITLNSVAANAVVHPASSNPIVANALTWKARNAVRGNTKLKSIDYWFADNGYGDDTLVKYAASYKRDRAVDFVDRYADTAARDAFYDAMYQLTGVKSKWALNSQLRARNAKDSDGRELEVGDKIKVQTDMHGRWDGGGVVTALKSYGIVEYKDIFGHINTTQENSVRKV